MKIKLSVGEALEFVIKGLQAAFPGMEIDSVELEAPTTKETIATIVSCLYVHGEAFPKIAAIKMVRQFLPKLGLAEAKASVEGEMTKRGIHLVRL